MGSTNQSFVPPVFVGVCGGSGSGKTTFCEILVSIMGPKWIAHLRQDDYYYDLSRMQPSDRTGVNFDHPDSIELPLLMTHLDYLGSGHDIALPKYDFKNHCRTASQQIVAPKPIVLVEGILLLSYPSLVSKLNHKIFIDTSEQVRFERRLRRDVRERGRTPESVVSQFENTVKPMHVQYVEANRQFADQVVSGEQPFESIIFDLCTALMREVEARSVKLSRKRT